MNFITEYVSLLMKHPLATPVASVGLLALTLHLVLPLLCEIWRYYPNKITGTDTLKNAYLEKLTYYKIEYKNFTGSERKKKCFYKYEDYSESYDQLLDDCSVWSLTSEKTTDYLGRLLLLGFLCMVATLASLLIEYLLANFFIYTLVAGLAVGLHFTVVLLGKKLYSVSEDVKALKEAGNKAETKQENTNDD